MSNNTHRPLHFYQLTVKCVGGEKYILYPIYLQIHRKGTRTFISLFRQILKKLIDRRNSEACVTPRVNFEYNSFANTNQNSADIIEQTDLLKNKTMCSSGQGSKLYSPEKGLSRFCLPLFTLKFVTGRVFLNRKQIIKVKTLDNRLKVSSKIYTFLNIKRLH